MGGYTQSTIRDSAGNITGYVPVDQNNPYNPAGYQGSQSDAYNQIVAQYNQQRGNVVGSSPTYQQGSFQAYDPSGNVGISGRAGQQAEQWQPIQQSRFANQNPSQPFQSTVPTRDLSSNAPTRAENLGYTQYDVRALEQVRSRPGFNQDLGDPTTRFALQATERMRNLGYNVASEDVMTGRTLEAQRQAAFKTPGVRDDQFYSGELQKYVQNKVELSSAYHHIGMEAGVPIPANRWEYQGDLAVELLKGQPMKDSEFFSPVSGEMSPYLPQYNGRGEGIQDYAWRQAQQGQKAGPVSYSAGLEKLFSAEGQYGPYGVLWGAGTVATPEERAAGLTQAPVQQANPSYGGMQFTSIQKMGPAQLPAEQTASIQPSLKFPNIMGMMFSPFAEQGSQTMKNITGGGMGVVTPAPYDAGEQYRAATRPSINPEYQKMTPNASAGGPLDFVSNLFPGGFFGVQAANEGALIKPDYSSRVSVESGMNYGVIPKPFIGVGKGGNVVLEATPSNEYQSSGPFGLGGLLPSFGTPDQQKAYLTNARSNPVKAEFELFGSGVEGSYSAGAGALNAIVSGVTFGLIPQTFKTTPITIRGSPSQYSENTVTNISGGSPELTRMGLEIDASRSSLDRYNATAASEFNTKVDLFNAMQKQNPTIERTTITRSIIPGTGTPDKIYGSEWDRFVEGSGRVSRNLLGFTETQYNTYGETIKNEPGLKGIADRTVYEVGGVISNKPASLAPDVVAGAAFVLGGEVIGAGIAGIAAGTSRVTPAAQWIMSPTGQTVVKAGAASFFGTLYGLNVTEGFTATPQRTEQNIERSILPLAAMYGGGGGFRQLPEVAMTGIRAIDARMGVPMDIESGVLLPNAVKPPTRTIDLSSVDLTTMPVKESVPGAVRKFDVRNIPTDRTYTPSQAPAKTPYEPFSVESPSTYRPSATTGRMQMEPLRMETLETNVPQTLTLDVTNLGRNIKNTPQNLRGRPLSMMEKARLQTPESNWGNRMQGSRSTAKANLETLRENQLQKKIDVSADSLQDAYEQIFSTGLADSVVSEGLARTQARSTMVSPIAYHEMITDEHMGPTQTPYIATNAKNQPQILPSQSNILPLQSPAPTTKFGTIPKQPPRSEQPRTPSTKPESTKEKYYSPDAPKETLREKYFTPDTTTKEKYYNPDRITELTRGKDTTKNTETPRDNFRERITPETPKPGEIIFPRFGGLPGGGGGGGGFRSRKHRKVELFSFEMGQDTPIPTRYGLAGQTTQYVPGIRGIAANILSPSDIAPNRLFDIGSRSTEDRL